jgi:ATP-dependent helicase/nuclease subunit B
MSARRKPWRRPVHTWQTLPPPPETKTAKVFSIAASAPFSATLAQGLFQRFGSGALTLANITLYLPTRRAVRGIAEIFARAAGGATLLPCFRPLGDVDEDELLLEGGDDLTLKPAIAPLRRRLLLAAFIRRWSHSRDSGAMRFAQAAAMARSLAKVLDEAETQGADLAKLADLAPAALAGHWAEVKDFLLLMRDLWAELLEKEGRSDPASHRDAALRALAKRLQEAPPETPVIAAGSTGSIPATAALLGVIARLPQGAVVLPGLDRELDADSWERLEPGHPQFALKQLLERIGVRRDQVADWAAASVLPDRERLLREVLRPAPTTDAWRALAESANPPGVVGLKLFEAADPAEEAAVIALLLREALETPERTAALVTRDRALARRVTTELGRWKIAIDDSAGAPLSRTPAGAFLSLLAEAADEGFAPVPLLALLKHPLAGDAAFRAKARDLDLHLRGPRPDSGLAGVAKALVNAPAALQSWFAQQAAILKPLEEALAPAEASLPDILAAHGAAAEALAPDLWAGPDGSEAQRFVHAFAEAAGALVEIETRSFAPLLRDLMAEVPVRPPFGRHPRLAILGPLEARMQYFDRVILGGLNEGVWPASAADDPWFSRPMRAQLGLEQPERAIGLSAHDFATLAAGPEVVLTRAAKAEGTPMVASRWLQRLTQLTAGLGSRGALTLDTKYRDFAAALSDPGSTAPMAPPYPCPPLEARPDHLSVTEIETWVRDPYAVYAKHVLGLKPLDPLDDEIGPLERGTALHRMLERFSKLYPSLPPDALEKLEAVLDEVFAELGTPLATLAVWRPRFRRAAEWFIQVERERAAAVAQSFQEIKGTLPFPMTGGEFILSCRADRIDRLQTGGAAIIDYKTGSHANNKQVRAQLAPQLPLEGAILAADGFGIGALTPEELIYLRLSGAAEAGKLTVIDGDAAVLAGQAADKLAKRILQFCDPAQGYAPRVAPFRADIAGDYDHLARVREWSSGWSDE